MLKIPLKGLSTSIPLNKEVSHERLSLRSILWPTKIVISPRLFGLFSSVFFWTSIARWDTFISGEFCNLPRGFDTLQYQFWENTKKEWISKNVQKIFFLRLIPGDAKNNQSTKKLPGNERISTSYWSQKKTKLKKSK